MNSVFLPFSTHLKMKTTFCEAKILKTIPRFDLGITCEVR